MATYTQRQAAKIVGMSRTTVGRHIAAGRLSCTRNEDGSVAIDASELIRVYADACDFDRMKKGAKPAPASDSAGDEELREVQAKLESLQEKLLTQYRDEIEHLKEALAKAQDGQAKVTALLEGHRRSDNDWQSATEASIAKIAHQTQTQIQELREGHEKEIKQLKRTLHQERNKTLWRRIFG